MRHLFLYATAMAALGISTSIYAAEPTTSEPTAERTHNPDESGAAWDGHARARS